MVACKCLYASLKINNGYFFRNKKIRIDKKSKDWSINVTLKWNLRSDPLFSVAPFILQVIVIIHPPRHRLNISKITIDNNSALSSNNACCTHIPPHNFNSESHLNQLQDNCLFDLSDTQVPLDVKLLLQLGGDFLNF